MVRKENTVAVEHLGGGKGTAYVHHIISKEEFLGHGRMYAKVVLPPGASVGWHQHVHDTAESNKRTGHDAEQNHFKGTG